jgi:hypothetical protein
MKGNGKEEDYNKKEAKSLSQKERHQHYLDSIAANAAVNEEEAKSARLKAVADTRTFEDIKRSQEEQKKQYMDRLREQEAVFNQQLEARNLLRAQERIRSRNEAVSILLRGIDISQLVEGNPFSQEVIDQIETNRLQLDESQLFFTTHEAYRSNFTKLLLNEMKRLNSEQQGVMESSNLPVIQATAILEQAVENIVEQTMVLEQEQKEEFDKFELIEEGEVEIKNVAQNVNRQISSAFEPVRILSQLTEEIESEEKESEETRSLSPVQALKLSGINKSNEYNKR